MGGKGLPGVNFAVTPMRLEDLEGVLAIEEESFPIPWSKASFLYELLENERAFYYVAKANQKVLGYIGMWMILDEGHITNLAVAAAYRRRGIGRALLQHLVEASKKLRIRYLTLEVRRSNFAAQLLYEELGFVGPGSVRVITKIIRKMRSLCGRDRCKGRKGEIMLVDFGVETSCDETAVAVVEDGCKIRSNLILSQVDRHRKFGGVVPELAARCHLEAITPLVEAALREAGVRPPEIGWWRPPTVRV